MERYGGKMAGMSIITSDEIMEITQLVFDRYYTELKRQLRKSELPEEETERHCTEILSKVYQAIQEQGVAAMSYEMDACAIPIINEEIRKILVPLHLNGYRNRRENPVPEASDNRAGKEENTIEHEPSIAEATESEAVEPAVKEEKKDAVQVVSNGQVQVYNENSENELNPELRTEIRRILQQEFQLEPAQVKPVVVVVNVTAPQAVVQQEAPVCNETKEEMPVTATVEEEISATANTESEEQSGTEPENIAESDSQMSVVCEEVILPVEESLSLSEIEIEEIQQADVSPETEEKKERTQYWLWIPIIILLVILLWLTIGMLMSYDIVPEFDLGYEWFNKVLFELF